MKYFYLNRINHLRKEICYLDFYLFQPGSGMSDESINYYMVKKFHDYLQMNQDCLEKLEINNQELLSLHNYLINLWELLVPTTETFLTKQIVEIIEKSYLLLDRIIDKSDIELSSILTGYKYI